MHVGFEKTCSFAIEYYFLHVFFHVCFGFKIVITLKILHLSLRCSRCIVLICLDSRLKSAHVWLTNVYLFIHFVWFSERHCFRFPHLFLCICVSTKCVDVGRLFVVFSWVLFKFSIFSYSCMFGISIPCYAGGWRPRDEMIFFVWMFGWCGLPTIVVATHLLCLPSLFYIGCPWNRSAGTYVIAIGSNGIVEIHQICCVWWNRHHIRMCFCARSNRKPRTSPPRWLAFQGRRGIYGYTFVWRLVHVSDQSSFFFKVVVFSIEQFSPKIRFMFLQNS